MKKLLGIHLALPFIKGESKVCGSETGLPLPFQSGKAWLVFARRERTSAVLSKAEPLPCFIVADAKEGPLHKRVVQSRSGAIPEIAGNSVSNLRLEISC